MTKTSFITVAVLFFAIIWTLGGCTEVLSGMATARRDLREQGLYMTAPERYRYNTLISTIERVGTVPQKP